MKIQIKILITFVVLSFGVIFWFFYHYNFNNNRNNIREKLKEKSIDENYSSYTSDDNGFTNQFKENQVYFTFNQCFIYKDSLDDSQILDTLNINTGVKIKNITSSGFEINGLKNSWVEVEYKQTNGFMKLSDFAYNKISLKDSLNQIVDILFNVTEYSEIQNKFTAQLIVLRNNQIIQQLDFEPFNPFDGNYFTYETNFELFNNKGLDGVKNILGLDFSYAACGYDNGFQYFIWDGGKMFLGTKHYYMGDADVYFKYEYSIFPSDSLGKKDTVYTQYKQGEFDGVDENGKIKLIDSSFKTTYYKWVQGTGLVE